MIARRDRIASTWPLMAPFEDVPDRIDKFDHWNLGTYNSALQAGIAPAIEMHGEVGAQAMHARVRELTRYWVALARSIRGFRLHMPVDDERLGAVGLFSIVGADMKHVERELRERHQVHVKYRRAGPLEGLRVSPHVYTRNPSRGSSWKRPTACSARRAASARMSATRDRWRPTPAHGRCR